MLKFAAELRAKIIECLKEQGELSTSGVAKAVNCKTSTAADYLHRLRGSGEVESVRVTGGRTAPSLHRIRLDKDAPTNVDRVRQSTLKAYPPNTTRDPYALPAEFFGQRQL